MIADTKEKMIAVKDLKEGMLMDLEGDKYADPNSDNVLLANEYQQVFETEQETDDCIKVASGDFCCGFPPEHMIKIIEQL